MSLDIYSDVLFYHVDIGLKVENTKKQRNKKLVE